MTSGYVSGETMLRPVRMGLLITQGSAVGLRQAVELAVASWGGQAFPILEATADWQDVLRMAVAMGVDCFYPVGDDDELKGLAKTPGFEWVPSWHGLSPFNRDPQGRGEHVLPSSVLYDWYRASRLPHQTVYHVSWPRDHQLADLLMVWFGCFGADAIGQADMAAFDALAQGCPLGPGLPLPPYPFSLVSQLGITMQDVFQKPRWQSRGIMVVEPGNVSHLASFWNLRACGQEVFPWAESHADLLKDPLTQWLDKAASVPSAAAGRLPELCLWLPPLDALPPRLDALIDSSRFRLTPQSHQVNLHACGPLMTSHVRRFAADISQSGEALISLPVLDFLPRRATWTDLGTVAADIDVWSESTDPAGDTAIEVPAARCIAPHLRSVLMPFTRPRNRGRVVPVRVSQETVSLTPVRADLLARSLASSAGYELAVTENGRRVHHLIRLLGGVTPDSLANQPAVREVIRKALRSPYGANAESLVGTAGSNEGGWTAKTIRRRGFKDYPAQVIGTLAQLGIFQPLACLKCPQCTSTIRVAPSALGEPVRCELCMAVVSFGAYIANSPGRPATWAMKVTPALDETHFNETVPVMAALSVFAVACGRGLSGGGMLYLVGTELTSNSATREVDFMILVQDADLPAVIIGEAKAGHPDHPKPADLLSVDDLDHLEAVQDAFRAIGIDCFICFATTRPALQPSEADLLRRSCERALMPVFDFKSLLLPALPVVLTGEDLSVPAMDDRHPARRADPDYPRLPALAKNTCQQQLDLADIDFTTDSSGNWQARPRW